MDNSLEERISTIIDERGFNDQGIPSIQCALIQYIKDDEHLIEDAEDLPDTSIRIGFLRQIQKEFIKHDKQFWLRCFNKYHNIEHTNELGTMGFWIDNPEEETALEDTTLGMKLMMKIEEFPNLIDRLIEYYEKIDKPSNIDNKISKNGYENKYIPNSKEWVLFEIGKMLKTDYRVIETEPDEYVRIMIEGGEIDFINLSGNKKYLRMIYYYILGKDTEIPKQLMFEDELKRIEYPNAFRKKKTAYEYILDNIGTCTSSKTNALEEFEKKLIELLKGYFESHE